MMDVVFVPLYKGPTIFENLPSPCSSIWTVWDVLNEELGRIGLKICWFNIDLWKTELFIIM